MFFASDNGSGVPEAVLASLARANAGPTRGYGNDPLTVRVHDRVRAVFEAPQAAVHLVATGTAANALALACLCPPWAAVFAHADAHAIVDECGAPEFYTAGAKLVPVAGEHGRMTPEGLAGAIATTGRVGVHSVQPGAVSLTNATEAGTVYRPADVAALAAVARAAGLPLHMDGARFANALAAIGCSPAELTWKAGVDVLSLGGTKNGLMGVEAVVLFDPARSWEFELRRKRGGHLFSKHRFLAAQMEAWLDGDLWLDLARRSNAMAARLEAGLAGVPGARLVHPRQANAVFAAWPRAAHRRAQAAGAAYYLWPADQTLEGPDDEAVSARLVASWCTTAEEVDGFVDILRG
ncbi:MAG: low specificity L-threonine aldolase [Rhodobacteraceae bacterium]|jgi:threonine aldolase|nr:low specificity L-threonine aldolase [Paracoccaceae bacterium]